MITALVTAFIAGLIGAHSVPLFKRFLNRPPRSKENRPHADAPPKLLIVQPCCHDEVGLEENLRATVLAAPEGSKIIFAIASEGDGARAVIERVISTSKHASCQITHAGGPNYKAMQLHSACFQNCDSSFDLLLTLDSDLRIRKGDIQELLRTISSQNTAAAWLPPIEAGPIRSIGDLASQAVLSTSLHAFPMLSHIDAQTMVGKAVIYRITMLKSVGGFAPFKNTLGEDIALAKALRAKGHRVLKAEGIALAFPSGRSFKHTVQRFSRWLMVIKEQYPKRLAAYPLLFSATTPICVYALILLPHHSVLAMAAALIGVRYVLMGVLQNLAGPPSHWSLWAFGIPLADLSLMLSFLNAISRRTVEWRGRRLLLKGATLHEPGSS